MDMASHQTDGANEGSVISDGFDTDLYNHAECLMALRGEKIPKGFSLEVTQICTIRGIRYHTGFGTELRGLGRHPEFTRALNAREIMSNSIPVMNEPEEFPYCIWYPDIATEDTYRQLAKRYPNMRYNVGRACAIGGYYGLFKELQLLPEISIAEEARENKETGQAIFDDIMGQPTRYAVMDDYTLTVNLKSPRSGAFLNGDTAVRFLLDIKQELVNEELFSELATDLGDYYPLLYYHVYDSYQYFNITEDFGIDEVGSEPLDYKDVVPLLYTPLPLDLPTVKKDMLIAIAAYHGDIDRYFRLRRLTKEPFDSFEMEIDCILRGIYHNIMFAKWMSLLPEAMQDDTIQIAITARFIMSDDLSRISAEIREGDLPYQIWYPRLANPLTYEELAHRNPFMKAAAARACIVGNYKESYDRIQPTPDYFLAQEAKASSNPYYLDDLKLRAEKLNINLEISPDQGAVIDKLSWRSQCTRNHLPLRGRGSWICVPERVTMDRIRCGNDRWCDSFGSDISDIELFVCVPDELKPTQEWPEMLLNEMYLQACRPDEKTRLSTRYPGGRGKNGKDNLGIE